MEYAPNQAPTPFSQGAATASAESHARDNAESPELAYAVSKGYEPHDVGVRGVMIFLASLLATVIVVLAFIYFLMFGLINFSHSGEGPASPVTVKYPMRPYPLQPSVDHDVYPREDMLQMRIDTQNILNNGGVTATGRRHIPISEAIEQVLSKLPVRTQGQS